MRISTVKWSVDVEEVTATVATTVATTVTKKNKI